MDHGWAADQLRKFVVDIDRLVLFRKTKRDNEADQLADEIVSLDPVMRDLMNAARLGFGEYLTLRDAESVHYNADYWDLAVKPWALRAIGVHTLGAQARERMRPDSPDLAADQFHQWVWAAAAPLWDAGSTQDAILAAGRSVNARLQQKIGRRDRSESALCREAFSLDKPKPGSPRLRFPGDQMTDSWRSRQRGGGDFGAGCFEGIRNPAAHEHGLVLTEKIALAQLAAFSVLACWIDECTVEAAP